MLDLDGDGIEATAIDAQHPVLFDHDASGSRTATGWIAPDDGLLVLDLDGNGTIDTGRELFGDNTLLSDGVTLAANGFDALSRYDTNVDHMVSALDPVWADLRIWQDTNQDGTSQPEELHTLPALGIETITVNAEASSLNLGNGNTMPWRGSFTRTDGSLGDSGTPELSGSLLLAANNFYRTFTDDPTPTPEALALPEMRGSGEVRDLRAAMSLGSDEAADLQDKLTLVAASTTYDLQMAQRNALLQSWSDTSSMPTISPPGFNSNSGDRHLTSIWQFAQSDPMVYAQITALEQLNGQPILEKWVHNETRLKPVPRWHGEMWKSYKFNIIFHKINEGYRHKTSTKLRRSPFAHLRSLSLHTHLRQNRQANNVISRWQRRRMMLGASIGLVISLITGCSESRESISSSISKLDTTGATGIALVQALNFPPPTPICLLGPYSSRINDVKNLAIDANTFLAEQDFRGDEGHWTFIYRSGANWKLEQIWRRNIELLQLKIDGEQKVDSICDHAINFKIIKLAHGKVSFIFGNNK